jgi:hypothetical protein
VCVGGELVLEQFVLVVCVCSTGFLGCFFLAWLRQKPTLQAVCCLVGREFEGLAVGSVAAFEKAQRLCFQVI